MAVYFAVLEPGDTILAMSLDQGGHLTHGHKVNFSGRFFNVVHYGVNRETELIDYDVIEDLAAEHKPKLICAGASAYTRIIDFKRLRKIADSVGALLMVDMAHIAGLVAAGCHPNPVPYCDFVTTTTHKTLRGPRGGMILCQERYAPDIDRPGLPRHPGRTVHAHDRRQGGLLPRGPAARVQDLPGAGRHECHRPWPRPWRRTGFRIVSGGTDNHLMLVDLTPVDVTGKDAAAALDKARITVNKNAIPFDTRSPFVTSGIRLGTPAVTTRGMKEPEMDADRLPDQDRARRPEERRGHCRRARAGHRPHPALPVALVTRPACGSSARPVRGGRSCRRRRGGGRRGRRCPGSGRRGCRRCGRR